MSQESPYTIISSIGKGGMAEVFKAVKKGPDGFEKIVALKKILPFYTDHPQFILMLSTEAKIHSKLDHPNIVQLYDFFSFQDQYMIAMEYVDGRNAKEVISSLHQKGIELPWQACVYIAIEILKALHYAHNKQDAQGPMGIVHRDISPHNILISFDGRVKLTDFGIANAKIKEDKTKSGVLKGKYRYLSPEQVLGETVTPQSDLFAVGTTLYELLTFEHPFPQQQEFELFKNIIEGNFKPVGLINPDLPIHLQDAIMLSMQPDPEDRFAQAKSFLDELLMLQDPAWLSFGAEKLSHFMLQAFSQKERVLPPVENTKILTESSMPLSVSFDRSLIMDSSVTSAQASKPTQWKLMALIGLVLLAGLVYGVTRMNADPTTSLANQPITQPSAQTNPTPMSQTTPENQDPTIPKTEKTTSPKTKPVAQPKSTTSPKKASKPKPKVAKAPSITTKQGLLTFSGPRQTEVFINGKLIGSLPIRQFFLAPGSYLVLMKKGDQQSITNVRVKAGETHHVQLQ